MKKLLFLLVILAFCSCGKTDEQILTEMKSPVILIGKAPDASWDTDVMVKDANGRIETFFNSNLAFCLHCRRIGDTIK